MTVKIDFIFDFASPNAYLSFKSLHDIVARTEAELNIIPCLLGGIFKTTGNQAPMIAFAGVKGKVEYEMLETQRFIEKHQLDDFKMNEHFPVNTLVLMRGAIAAEQGGQLLEYIEAGLKAMWEKSLKMDDPEVFVAALTDAGLDGARLLEQTRDPAVKAKLVANTEAAVQRGAFGIPTFYVGEEMFFGKDRLRQLEEEVLKADS
ncbi:MAG: 2-hydroxychromene-2-carboxylate isomerase [Alcanivorax sp.]|jgi:2-hydroxychromene-2-carboxylate isomerase